MHKILTVVFLFLIEELTFLSPSDFEGIVVKHPRVFSPEVEGYARLAYGLERFLIVGFSRARDEGLLRLIEKATRSVVRQDPPFFFHEVFKTYFTGEHFGSDSSKLGDVLKLFALPAVREFLAAKMNFNLPTKPMLTLQDVLAAHPKTRAAYKPFPRSFTDLRVARFLKAVPNGSWRGIDYSPLPDGGGLLEK